MRAVALVLLVTACAPTLAVRGVVIHRGGLTELEHRGAIGEGFALPVDPHAANSLVVRELDGAVVASERSENVVHVLAGGERVVRYVAEGAPYEVRYRLSVEGDRASLSARALVHNTTPFDWRDVEITLTTDDPRGQGGIVWMQVPAPGDADGDHVLDAGDRCVDAAETYDGNLDDDGCPDVVIPLEDAAADERAVRVSFQRDAAAPDEEALSVLAALLAGAPTVHVRVVVHGRADEVDGWPLAEARAQAVIEGLVARGVARERLSFSLAFTTEEPFASFEIEGIEDAAVVRTEPVFEGDHRVAAHPTITVARGGEVEVELGEEAVRATPIVLYRAGLSEASHTELYRAIQLTLADGTPRLPGTVEIVIDGVRVGEAALDGAALDGGTAWLPYALDTECAITVEVTQSVEPIVALALEGDDLRAAVHFAQHTTYDVRGPRSAPRWIAHRMTPGMTLRELPPGAVSIGEELFVPLGHVPLAITEVVEGETIVALTDETLYLAPYLADAPSALVEQVMRRQAHLEEIRALDYQLFSIWSSVLETEQALSALEATLRAAAPHERPALEEELSRLRAAHAELEARCDGISQEIHALERLEILDASDD